MAMDEPLVRLQNVDKYFGDLHVLRGIEFSLDPGEVTVIIGPSGSGKSTLLRTVNLLELPTSGAVWFRGRDITDVRVNLDEIRTHVGMVFQSYNLFPNLNVLSNVTLALRKVLKLGKAEARGRALEELRFVGLEDKVNARTDELSGGQQQRVAIARALAMRPEVMLFDEVTSALDPELVKEVLEAMRRLVDKGMTMMIVTHEMGFAREVGSRLLFVDDGQILEDAAPRKVLEDPQDERCRQFLSHVL